MSRFTAFRCGSLSAILAAGVLAATAVPVRAAAPGSFGEPIAAQGGKDLDRGTLASLFPRQDPCRKTALRTPPPERRWEVCFALPGGTPADPQVAVGAGHLVVTSQAQLAFYAKAGRYLGSLPAARFFALLGLTELGIKSYGDLRAAYDEYRGRFWVGAMGTSSDRRRAVFAIAVSKSADPLEGWFLYWWHVVDPADPSHRPGDGADDPALGIDPLRIHQTSTVSNVEPGTDRPFTLVTHFPAQSLANGAKAPVIGRQYRDLRNPDGSPARGVRPLIHHRPVQGIRDMAAVEGRAFYVNRQEDGQVVVWALQKSSNFVGGVVVQGTQACLPPQNADQKGSPHDQKLDMTSLGTTILKAVQRNDRITITANEGKNTADSGGDASWDPPETLTAARVMSIDVVDAPKLVWTRAIGIRNDFDDGRVVAHYGWPAVEVNQAGHTAVVYTRSGHELFPESRYSVFLADEPDFGASALLKNGEAPFEIPGNENPVLPWGQAGGASVDPLDDSLWLTHQSTQAGVRGSSGNSSIWVVKVVLPPPSPIFLRSLQESSGRAGMPLQRPPRPKGGIPCGSDPWGPG